MQELKLWSDSMRVTTTLLLLALLTLGIPAGTAALYSESQTGASDSSSAAQPLAQQATQTSRSSQFAQFSATPAPTAISLLGAVEAYQTAPLTFRTSGTVSEVLVKEGDFVNANTVIARLDRTNQQSAYDQAVLNLEKAQLNLQDLQQPPSDSDVRVARANLASAQASYNNSVNSTSASDLQSAQIKYQQATDAYNLAVQQRDNMNGTQQQIDLADAKVGQASFNMQIAQLQLQKLQTPNNASQWTASARLAVAQLQYQQALQGATQAQLDSAQLALEIAQQQVTTAQTALDRTELISPISGVVTAVNISVGDTASTGTVAIELTDMSELLLKAPLHELDLESVSTGSPATVTLDALPSLQISATVDHIAWLGVESSGIVQYDVWLKLNSDDPRIRLGMTGEASITPSV
jgi:HlyD family secretion protein